MPGEKAEGLTVAYEQGKDHIVLGKYDGFKETPIGKRRERYCSLSNFSNQGKCLNRSDDSVTATGNSTTPKNPGGLEGPKKGEKKRKHQIRFKRVRLTKGNMKQSVRQIRLRFKQRVGK